MSEFTRQLRSSSTSAASWSIESRNTPGMDATSSRTPAPGFTVTARAADGVIEGVEDPERNLYAVQWHPEDLVESHPRFRPLFRHLVERAGQYAGR